MSHLDAHGPYVKTKYRPICPPGCSEVLTRTVSDYYMERRDFRVWFPVVGFSFSLFDPLLMVETQWYRCCCKENKIPWDFGEELEKVSDEKEVLDYGLFRVKQVEAITFHYELHKVIWRYTYDPNTCKEECKAIGWKPPEYETKGIVLAGSQE